MLEPTLRYLSTFWVKINCYFEFWKISCFQVWTKFGKKSSLNLVLSLESKLFQFDIYEGHYYFQPKLVFILARAAKPRTLPPGKGLPAVAKIYEKVRPEVLSFLLEHFSAEMATFGYSFDRERFQMLFWLRIHRLWSRFLRRRKRAETACFIILW